MIWTYRIREKLSIWLSFFIAAFLQVFLSSTHLYPFCPFWTKLVFIYWVVIFPYQININTGFVIGFFMDLVLGSTLGTYALEFSTLGYLVAVKHRLLKNITLLQQIPIIILLLIVPQIITFLVRFLVMCTTFHLEILWRNVISGLSWPPVFFLMKKIHRRFFVTPKIFY